MDYLSTDYIDTFKSTLNNNICSDNLVTINNCNNAFLETTQHGFKSVVIRLFELIRYLGIQYFDDTNKTDFANADEFKDISKDILILDSIITSVTRPWYNNLLTQLDTYFADYVNQLKLINVSIFIVLIVTIIIIYFIVWKAFEDNMKELVKYYNNS